MSQELSLNICFIGYSQTGKTSLIQAYLTNQKITNPGPTFFTEFNHKNLSYLGYEMRLQLTEFPEISFHETGNTKINFYRNAGLFIIVIDASKSPGEQIETIKKWKADIQQYAINNYQLLIIANPKLGIAQNLSEDHLRQADITEKQYCQLNLETLIHNQTMRERLQKYVLNSALIASGFYPLPEEERAESTPLLRKQTDNSPSLLSSLFGLFCCCCDGSNSNPTTPRNHYIAVNSPQ